MKKTKLERFNNMKKFLSHYEVNDLAFFNEEKNDEIWYGDNLITIYYNDYKIELNTCGETRGTIVYRDKNGTIQIEDYCDKNEDGLVGKILKRIGVVSDREFENVYGNYDDEEQMIRDFEEMEQEGKKVLIASWDNNWFELDTYHKDNDDKYNLVYDSAEESIESILFDSEEELVNYIDEVKICEK